MIFNEIAASVRQEFFKHLIVPMVCSEEVRWPSKARLGIIARASLFPSLEEASLCATAAESENLGGIFLANGAYELVPVLLWHCHRCRRPTDATRSGADPSFSYDGHVDSFGDAVLSWFGDGSQVLASLGIAARQRDCRRDCCSRVHSTVSVGGRKRCYI